MSMATNVGNDDNLKRETTPETREPKKRCG
jgi:hypothetical protein